MFVLFALAEEAGAKGKLFHAEMVAQGVVLVGKII
jgi:hypothetical protein